MKLIICVLVSFSLFANFSEQLRNFNKSQNVDTSVSTGPQAKLDTSANLASSGSVICPQTITSVPKEFLDLLSLDRNEGFKISINNKNEISISALRFADCLNGRLEIGVDKNANVAGRVIVVAQFINGATLESVKSCVASAMAANDGSSEKTITPNPFLVEDLKTDSAVVSWGFKGSEAVYKSAMGEDVAVSARQEGNCYNLQDVEDNSLIAYTEQGRKWSNIKMVCESGNVNDIMTELDKNREYADIQRVLEYAGMEEFEELIRQYAEEIENTDPPSDVVKKAGELNDFHEKLKAFLIGEDEESGILHRWQAIRNKKGDDDGKYDDEIKRIDEFLKLVVKAFGPQKDIMKYLMKEGAFDDVEEAAFNGNIALMAINDRTKKDKPKTIINKANRKQRNIVSQLRQARRKREVYEERVSIREGNIDPNNLRSREYQQRYSSRMQSYRSQQEEFARFQREAYQSLNRRCNGVIQNKMFTFQLPRVNTRRSYENCMNLQQNFSRQAEQHRNRMNRTLQQAQGFQQYSQMYAQDERIGWQNYLRENAYFDGFSDSEYLNSGYLDDYDLYTQFGSQDLMNPGYYGMNMPPLTMDPSLYSIGNPGGPDMFGNTMGQNPFQSYSPSMFGMQQPGVMPPQFGAPQNMAFPQANGRMPAGMFSYP